MKVQDWSLGTVTGRKQECGQSCYRGRDATGFAIEIHGDSVIAQSTLHTTNISSIVSRGMGRIESRAFFKQRQKTFYVLCSL